MTATYIPRCDHVLVGIGLLPLQTLYLLFLLLRTSCVILSGSFHACPTGSPRSCLLLFEDGYVQFVFRILVDVSKILGDAVIRSKMLLCKVNCLFIAENGCGVGTKELLFDTHVVVGDG